MAMHDWNGNGKKDWGDDFIEYHIFKEVTGGSGKKTNSGGGCLTVLLLAAIPGALIAGGVVKAAGSLIAWVPTAADVIGKLM